MLLSLALSLPGGGNVLAASDASLSGRQLYNSYCYFCHGYSGDAKTVAARYLTPPPRDFTHPESRRLSREEMIQAVTSGRNGTAMKGFSHRLSADEIRRVVDFVGSEFVSRQRENTRYHTAANGWPNHERYAAAYPFATGELATDRRWESLTESQRQGLRLFQGSCTTCHDRGRVREPGPIWQAEAVSYPRLHFQTGDFLKPADVLTGASPFARHDIEPPSPPLSASAVEGRTLFQENCAFCHGADGSGKNWIGHFLDPPARDLRDPALITRLQREGLITVIAEGIPGSAMPSWKWVLSGQQLEQLADYIYGAFHSDAPPHPAGTGGTARVP